MYTLSEARNLIEKHIQAFSIPETPTQLYEPVRYVLSMGGKRIRPALVLLSCDMFAGAVDSAMMPAQAIEVFHNLPCCMTISWTIQIYEGVSPRCM